MSYILDALRRAEAERERGRVPTLQAQSGPTEPAGADVGSAWPRPAPRGLGLGLAGLALLLSGAAGAYWWTRPAMLPPVAATRPAPPPLPLTAAPAPAAAPVVPVLPPEIGRAHV